MSRRGVQSRVWQASQYEFEDVIDMVDDTELISLGAQREGAATELARQVRNRAGKLIGRPRRGAFRPVAEATDCDLFFAVFAAPTEINALPFVTAQLARSKRKVAFIVEMYSTQIASSADYIRQLRGFDHIFVFTRDVIPAIREISGVPTSFLETGIDADVFVPDVPGPARVIDVASYGRRLEEAHRALQAEMRSDDFYYSYETVAGAFSVIDHREHRAALAARLQRSRYSIVYKNNDEPKRIARTGGEETLTNRYFEVTSAGALLLGSAPDVPDFARCFDWPDAMISVPVHDPRVGAVIRDFDRDPDRVERASTAGMLAGLRRHDWAYRWRDILDAVGLTPHDRLTERLGALEVRAAARESFLSQRPSALRGEGPTVTRP